MYFNKSKFQPKSVNILLSLLCASVSFAEDSEKFVNDLIQKMTLEEKVGQMTQVDKRMLDNDQDIADYFLGSILSGGGSVPDDNTPKGWINMVNSYQQKALSTRLKIPLIYGIDAVHGHSNVVGATIFPQNIGLGCTNSPDIVEQVNHATAVEVAATGLHWTFSPCVTVPQDDRWGRQYEGFSESTDLVSKLTPAAIKGYENALEKLNGRKIAACAKHFIGDGGTTWETGSLVEGIHTYKIDRGDTKISEGKLRELYLPPYVKAIEAGVKTIMVSFNSWNGVKCHGDKFLVNDLLKEELGFKGFVVSDWAGIDEIPGDYKSDIITSINAGIDLVMVPGALYGQNHYKTFIKLLKESVKEGSIKMSRIDDAVTRILGVKYNLGLFADPFSKPEYAEHVGLAEHRSIARDAVRKSMVLLKNDSNVLPIAKDETIYVVGSGANNLGMQSGGWTVEWQGRMTPDFTILDEDGDGQVILAELTRFYQSIYESKYNSGGVESGFKSMDKNSNGSVTLDEFKHFEASAPFQPAGTSILDAIKQATGNTGSIVYDPRAKSLGKNNLVVAVVGEFPYSEGYGDNPSIGLSSFDTTVLKRCYQSENKIAVVMLSGRPLIIKDHIDKWDALVAAWLPGMAGEGIADVLFGDYSPTGKLSFSWPKDISQVPLNYGDSNYDPLFPFGYGLTY